MPLGWIVSMFMVAFILVVLSLFYFMKKSYGLFMYMSSDEVSMIVMEKYLW